MKITKGLITQLVAEVMNENNITSGGEVHTNRKIKKEVKLKINNLGPLKKEIIDDLKQNPEFIFDVNWDDYGPVIINKINKMSTEEELDKFLTKITGDNGYLDDIKYNMNKSPINEVSYRSFNKNVNRVTPKTKVRRAIKEIAKQIKHIDSVVDHSRRLKEELGIKDTKNDEMIEALIIKISEIRLKLRGLL